MLAEPGFHTRAFVEWEDWPRTVLIAAQRAGYFAPAPIWDDLRTFDERGKLSKQVFGTLGHLILAGAGGKIVCAACVPIAEAQDLVVDQTLYWKVVADADEAWYQVGMLNSLALTNATLAFNPKGDFGERHLHTLPYRMMPSYDASNFDHLKIAALSRDTATLAEGYCTTDLYLANPTKSLSARRRRMRALLEASPPLMQLEALAKSALIAAASGKE